MANLPMSLKPAPARGHHEAGKTGLRASIVSWEKKIATVQELLNNKPFKEDILALQETPIWCHCWLVQQCGF